MNYLTEEEAAYITEEIRLAEEFSTGEIRVHIDNHSDSDFAKQAWAVFHSMGMSETKDRNAVLFHVSFRNHYLTVIGDEGIHTYVSQSFWDEIHLEMTEAFKQKDYVQGLVRGIRKTGQELKKHFPVQGENPNELPNDISYS